MAMENGEWILQGTDWDDPARIQCWEELMLDFRQRNNKRGVPYCWPISVYTTTEALWGYDHITSAYSLDPKESKVLIYAQVRKNFPEAAPETLDAVLGWNQ